MTLETVSPTSEAVLPEIGRAETWQQIVGQHGQLSDRWIEAAGVTFDGPDVAMIDPRKYDRPGIKPAASDLLVIAAEFIRGGMPEDADDETRGGWDEIDLFCAISAGIAVPEHRAGLQGEGIRRFASKLLDRDNPPTCHTTSIAVKVAADLLKASATPLAEGNTVYSNEKLLRVSNNLKDK